MTWVVRMSVWRTVVALAAVVVLLVPLTSCDDDPASPNQLYSVTYSLTIHRSRSTVTVLTYKDQSGTVTVNNPASGWSIQVAVSGGTTVGMTAQGTVDRGSIEIHLNATDSGGAPVYTGQDSCASEGGAVPCNLAIPDSTFPS